jgi:hypothetical protein
LVLDELLQQLGYSSFVIGTGIGDIGDDWGTNPLSRLDKYIMECEDYYLNVLTSPPRTRLALTHDWHPPLTYCIPVGAAVEPPALVLPDEVVMFDYARYRQAKHEVHINIVTPEGRTRYKRWRPAQEAIRLIAEAQQAGARRFGLPKTRRSPARPRQDEPPSD